MIMGDRTNNNANNVNNFGSNDVIKSNGTDGTRTTDAKPPALPNYYVSRKVLLQENVNKCSGYSKRDKNYLHTLKDSAKGFSFLTFILNLIPVLKWLPKYSIKEQLTGDVIAGITVAVMHIPQGMAYGLLAGVTPSAGLYMAFFPTLTYFLFGTSRHISVGTLSLISLMTLRVVQTNSILPENIPTTQVNNSTIIDDLSTYYTPYQVVTATAFMCGVIHILMSIFRLGNLSSLLSDSLINGFTTGAAVHVAISQLKDLFGIKIPQHKGTFQALYTVIDACQALPSSNIKTVIISFTIMFFMIFMNELIKPLASKKFRFPIPAELLAVVGATLASYYLKFGTNYNVKLVGNIPLGLPMPEMPPISLLPKVAIDSIAISVISYTITISMAMIFAHKRHYEVRPNQELLALGLSNIVGGVFLCIPNATSLSRSLIQEQTGGNTQIASVVSALLILIILLWIGPFFEVLPRCVLAGIILVALKGMFTQAAEFKKYRKEGKMEALTWLVTFVAVVLVDIDIGLICGVSVSIVALYVKGWKSECCELGVVGDTNIYVNLKTHENAMEISNIKIFQYTGAINFATRSSFKKSFYKTIDISNKNTSVGITDSTGSNSINNELEPLNLLHSIIIDLSSVTHIDLAACKIFTEIQTELKLLKIMLLFTNVNDRVFDAFEHSLEFDAGPFNLLPSIHDAVLYAKDKYEASKIE